MKRIWAPWRMKYIKGGACRGKECFLCRMAAAQDNGPDNLVLLRTGLSLVVMNRFPYTNGHLLVAPLRHVAWLEDMTLPERTEMTELTVKGLRILKQHVQPQGFNVGLNLGSAAGAGLAGHVHQHLVPRWDGDTNFMPVLGETRVIPQSLPDLWKQLKPAFATAR